MRCTGGRRVSAHQLLLLIFIYIPEDLGTVCEPKKGSLEDA